MSAKLPPAVLRTTTVRGNLKLVGGLCRHEHRTAGVDVSMSPESVTAAAAPVPISAVRDPGGHATVVDARREPFRTP
jgi:hypothetical protein